MYHFYEMIPSEETQLAANAGKLELIKLHDLLLCGSSIKSISPNLLLKAQLLLSYSFFLVNNNRSCVYFVVVHVYVCVCVFPS